MLLALLDTNSDVRHTPRGDEPCVDDALNWFWFVLPRWADADITNGPKLVTSSALAAYRALSAAKRGEGPRLRCLLYVFVRGRDVLGAVVGESSGYPTLDDLARRLYPPPPAAGAEVGAEVFKVSVYGRRMPAEDTFSYELDSSEP